VCPSGSASVYGTDADEVIGLGQLGAPIAWGGAGEDEIHGGLAGDVIFGGPGDDFIEGGPGRDVIVGGLGDDTILINLDCMVLEGEVVDGGPGTDTIRSHLGQYALEGLGLTIVSVENFVVVNEDPRGPGACDPFGVDEGPMPGPPVTLSWSGLT